MSIDSQIEDAAYKAVDAVIKMIWPKQRERILKIIVIEIMTFMKWPSVTLLESNDEKTDKQNGD